MLTCNIACFYVDMCTCIHLFIQACIYRYNSACEHVSCGHTFAYTPCIELHVSISMCAYIHVAHNAWDMMHYAWGMIHIGSCVVCNTWSIMKVADALRTIYHSYCFTHCASSPIHHPSCMIRTTDFFMCYAWCNMHGVEGWWWVCGA